MRVGITLLKNFMQCYLVVFMCAVTAYGKTKSSTDNVITFGQSATFDGSFGLYGKIIKNGILACMYRVNDQGGVRGKKLNLVSLNDSGDPRQTQKNVDQLLSQGIDMFIGNMGTRSVLKILPYIQDEKIAMFFPWGSDEKLRDSSLTNIINGPGLLKPQLTAIVDYIEKNIRHRKIAIFHADDDFSISASHDLTAELKRRDVAACAVASYNRFTLDIETAANNLLPSDPKIVICLATSTPVVKLINNFFLQGHYGTTFFGIDSTFFVGDIIRARGADFYYSSAVPNPLTSSIGLAKQYLQDIEKYFPQENPNVLSFTYYVAVAIIVEAMKNTSGDITKEKIIEEIENMKNYSVDGFPVTFESSSRQAFGSDVTIIKG